MRKREPPLNPPLEKPSWKGFMGSTMKGFIRKGFPSQGSPAGDTRNLPCFPLDSTTGKGCGKRIGVLKGGLRRKKRRSLLERMPPDSQQKNPKGRDKTVLSGEKNRSRRKRSIGVRRGAHHPDAFPLAAQRKKKNDPSRTSLKTPQGRGGGPRLTDSRRAAFGV